MKSNSSLEFLHSCDPRIGNVYRYWDSKRRGRRMPARADIDPVEIPSYLPNVILVDVTRDPLDFRYRLVGTDIVQKRGHDPTGKRVAEGFFGSSAEFVLGNYTYVVENRTVQFADTPFVEPRGWYVYFERLFMPLSGDGENVDMIFVYALWNDMPRAGESP